MNTADLFKWQAHGLSQSGPPISSFFNKLLLNVVSHQLRWEIWFHFSSCNPFALFYGFIHRDYCDLAKDYISFKHANIYHMITLLFGLSQKKGGRAKFTNVQPQGPIPL